MRRPVKTKTDFVQRYRAGEFGNASPTWDTVEDFIGTPESRGVALYHLRNRIPGGPTEYNVPGWAVWAASTNLVYLKQVELDQIYVSAMAPTNKTLIQGEVMQWHRGLYLYYSTLRLPMREALAKRPQEVQGIMAVSLLRHYMNQRSYDWLEYLLEEYPDHVIEFSVYSECWGTVPGFNTVYWEVRQY